MLSRAMNRGAKARMVVGEYNFPTSPIPESLIGIISFSSLTATPDEGLLLRTNNGQTNVPQQKHHLAALLK